MNRKRIMDNPNEASVIELIESVMWYVDEHVEDAGTADNINYALHGIVKKLGGAIEEPPHYKAMQERARSIVNVQPVPSDTPKRKWYRHHNSKTGDEYRCSCGLVSRDWQLFIAHECNG